MNFNETKVFVESAFESDIPVFIWSDPGAGKSSLIQSIGKENDVEVRDIRATQIESVDLRGLPSINNGTTVWHIPSFMPTDPDSHGIIFLDELNRGDPSVQSAAFQLVLDRKLGDYVLPDGWRICAAGNPDADPLDSALSNRFMHGTLSPSYINWAVWARREGLNADIIGFLGSRPNLLFTSPSDTDENAYATPRTWEYAARAYEDHKTSGIWENMIKGCVGEGVLTEFLGYMHSVAQLPSLQDVINDPYRWDFSDSPSEQAAMCMLIVDGMNVNNALPLMQYVNRIQKEFQVLVITMINETRNKLMGVKPIGDWIIQNQGVL